MSQPPLDIEHLRLWIGREERASDDVTIGLVHRFWATLDLSGEPPSTGETAPLLVNYCLSPLTVETARLGEDGHPEKGGFLPPVPLPRRMWAGSEIILKSDIRVGDSLRRASRIADVTVKEGRSGVLCFVTIMHEIDRDGDVLFEEVQHIVYLGGAGPAIGSGSLLQTVPEGTISRPVSLSTPLLFRYSALTFNAHRIHYDHPYATGVENYPGLVVHGPLQATWLLNYAKELRGQKPVRFSFRGVSPLFDHDRVRVHATESRGAMQLWTARENGQVGMSAEATWS